MPIRKEDIVDADIVDAAELGADGSVVYLTLPVVSTNNGTSTVVVTVDANGEGITNQDHNVEVGDIVVISGTSGGLGDGIFSVASIVSNTSFTVSGSIGTSTGGSADFKYLSGAKKVGFDPTGQATTSLNAVQSSLQEISNVLLLNDDPLITQGTLMSITRTGNQVTQILWTNGVTTNPVKRTDFTYSGNQVSTEVTRIFGTDGVTELARGTTTYIYSGINLNSATFVRNL